MKQHIEHAAIALGVGVLAYIAYRNIKPQATGLVPAMDNRNFTDPRTYYTAGGQVSSAGILDARDAMAWGGRNIGSVQ